ncbi:MAG: hypothetical protein Q8N02_05270 [Methylotenera sp.]|nr:hypothetical protein [Methylotenera sp.]MDP2403873.1 hypothetical protein [Methylotenera sp.]MDP3094976.1 hypothetical protein [Methylotenera sp.]MDZ4222044.1 hypothetical protein [Methylotenera sp.]
MTFTEFLALLANYYDFSLYCSAHQVGWVGCNKFWGVIYLSTILILFIVCYKLVFKLLRQRKEWQAYSAKKAEREKIADPETMANHVWNGDY